MIKNKREILVTFALPYANESLHLGNMLEIIQADIWVRFQRKNGNKCFLISGDDAHGTPIMISAKKKNISPEKLIEEVKKKRIKEIKCFNISVDNYHTTHSQENKYLIENIYTKIKNNGDIQEKEITQAYDIKEKMFLPDRYIKGTCPKCKSKEEYGDNCSACGSHYSSNDLENPISIISNTTPVRKKTLQIFFNLKNYHDALNNWISEKHLQSVIVNKLKEWTERDNLKSWNISRDEPYFGFKIPNMSKKYFYVWMDAPIGYLASFLNLCKKKNIDFHKYWENPYSKTEIYHFIGKDIIYFHAIFWIAILKSINYKTPNKIFTHGFLKINNQKMSKSKKNFISTEKYIDIFKDPDYIRYYFASKLDSTINDIDLNLKDFMQKVNHDLIGKIVNIFSRTSKFINKYFNSFLFNIEKKDKLYVEFLSKKKEIDEYYEKLEYKKVIIEILYLSNKINKLIDLKKPWILIKNKDLHKEVHILCSLCLNLYRILIFYMDPILPSFCNKSRQILNINNDNDNSINIPLINHKIRNFKIIMSRIRTDQIEQILK